MNRLNLDGLPLHQTGRWLVFSGIQNTSRDRKLRGGVAGWYDIYQKHYPFLYSEITGYAISTLVFLNRLCPHRIWLQRAHLAAEWIVRNAFRFSGGVRTRLYLIPSFEASDYAFHRSRIYAFDTSMVAYGLLQLYRLNPNRVYLDHIDKSWVFLTKVLKSRSFDYYPYFNLRSKRRGEDLQKWSGQVGSFHAKLALFFIDYYRLTNRQSAKETAIRLLDRILETQEKDGRFVTHRKNDSTHLHPHCYTLEGLIYGHVFLGKKSYGRAVQKGFKWVLRAVSEDGSVSAVYEKGRFAFHERSDIIAQVLRIGSILYGLNGRQSHGPDRHFLKRIYDHLLLFQFTENGSQNGGILYGSDTDGRNRNHLNAWSSMFALQSAWMYNAFVLNKKPVDLESFV